MYLQIMRLDWCSKDFACRRCISQSASLYTPVKAKDNGRRNRPKELKGTRIPLTAFEEYLYDSSTASLKQHEFSKLGVRADLVKLLIENNISEPTAVQSEVIPSLLKHRSAVIASQTGSGKTLAYLLPVIQNMKRFPCSHLIVVPTRELATQVFEEAIKYGVHRDSVSRLVSGVNPENERPLRQMLKSPILIGTPNRLFHIVDENPEKFNRVRSITMDEVDKLLLNTKILGSKKAKKRSRSLNPDKIRPMEKLFTMLNHRGIQNVALSATISTEVVEKLKDISFSNQSLVLDLIPKGGAIPSNIKHHHYCVESMESAKIHTIGQMMDLLNQKSAMVFLKQGDSVEKVVDEFKELGFRSVALHQQLTLPDSSPDANKFYQDFESGEIQIVVTNEDGMRGMDFPSLDTAFITFTPDHHSTYVHLAGRVGRRGQPSRVITMLSGHNYDQEYEAHKGKLDLLGVKSTRLAMK